MSRFLPLTIAFLVSATAMSDTIKVESTGHYIRLNDPKMIELEGNNEAYLGYRRHISVEGNDGQSESHWCFGTNVMAGESLSFGGGYCIIIDEDGDAYWTWFQLGSDGGFNWQVMGGTGKYLNASGQGVSRATKILPDGSATLEIQGSIEIADNQ